MSEQTTRITNIRITGGCQCGAVRYALHETPREPHSCHCRMCQKAFGAYFAPLAKVLAENFELTRGVLATFMSSGQAARGFCRDCGTPLTLQDEDATHMFIALGALDEPAKVKPQNQYGIEARMGWFADLHVLPGDKTTEEDDPGLAARIAASNRQHPDHDTDSWPPEENRS